MENFATVREGGLQEKQRGIFREGDVRITEGLVPIAGRRVALFWCSRTRWARCVLTLVGDICQGAHERGESSTLDCTPSSFYV